MENHADRASAAVQGNGIQQEIDRPVAVALVGIPRDPAKAARGQRKVLRGFANIDDTG